MADSKISALSAVTTVADADEYVLARSGASNKITGANLKSQVIASDAEIAALAGLTSAADKLPYFTGSGAAALADFTAAGRALVDDADAAAQRTTLGLGTLATLSAVASAQITDGTIVAADIAPAARARDWRSISAVPNVIAESIPRWAATNNISILGSGALRGQIIPVLSGDVYTNASFWQGSTAFTAATNAWFALADSALNLVRQSTDQLTAGITSNTLKTLALDSIPVTAGSRSGTTTVTLTFPTLSQALTSLIAVGDSIVVSNANIAAYNGTFTVVTVSATQITYVAGSSASDSLAAPFPTVQLAAGKRTYTVPTDGYMYVCIMLKGTVGTHFGPATASIPVQSSPIMNGPGQSSLTGTCPSPITVGGGSNTMIYAALS